MDRNQIEIFIPYQVIYVSKFMSVYEVLWWLRRDFELIVDLSSLIGLARRSKSWKIEAFEMILVFLGNKFR